jgi:hypothetical protein
MQSNFTKLCFVLSLLFITTFSKAQNLTETFTNVPNLFLTGWAAQNLSTSASTTLWAQGATTYWNSFDNAGGLNTDWAMCDFNSVSTGTGTVSNWGFTPNLTTLSNGDTIRFFTRTSTTVTYPDRLQIRISVNGASTNVGATDVSVGDFTYLQADINPTYSLAAYPTGYPTAWTQIQIIVSGLPAGNQSGRIAFRYFVENGGPSGVNSFRVGIDNFEYRDQVAAGGNTITTGIVTGSPFCPGATISIPYTITGTFTGGNVFTAQLSDAIGSFATPVAIGTLASTAAGTISGTIPTNIQPGGLYRIRVVASTPATTGTPNTANLVANPVSVSITPSTTTVCPGSPATLTASVPDRFYGVNVFNNSLIRFNQATPGVAAIFDTLPNLIDAYSGDIGPGGFYYILDDFTGDLYRINLGTFARTVVGNAAALDPLQTITGLAWNSFNSTMYATTTDGTTSKLYRIDPNTAATVLVGTITNVAGAIWLAINNTGQAYAADITTDNLYSVNLTTGAGTLVGALGVDINFAQDADFDPVTNILYTAAYNATTNLSEFRTINTTTGASTLIGVMVNAGNSEIDGFAIAGLPTYNWSSGGTTQAISATTAGSYTVTITNASGCTATATQVLTSGSVTAGITPTNPNLCAGATNITASGGGTYLWSTGATTATISISNSGTYTVTVTGASGCTATASVSATSGSVAASINPPTASICSGSSVQLTASGGNSYLWSTGATSATITASNSGVYTVTVTGTGGCTGTASINVGAGSPPTATITPSGSTTFCQGGTLRLTAGTGSSYLWSNGATNAIIDVTSSGAYIVTVTGANGCTATASQTVTVNQAPSASINANGSTTLCPGGSVGLTANGGGSYLWSTGASTASITATSANTYTVTVSGSNSCSATANILVTAGSVPSATITPGGNTTFCQGGSVLLTAGGGNSYLWSNGASTAAISATASGLYTVTVTGASGCTATTSQTVTVNNAPTPSITPSSSTNICPGSSVDLTGGGGNSYNWSTGSSNATITVNSAGTYIVTVTGSNGCTASSSQQVNIQSSQATITPNGSTSICLGSNVILNASNGVSYLWSTGATTSSITVTQAGNYTLTVTANGGCTATASQSVSVNTPPTAAINVNGPTTLCGAGSTSLTASGNGSFLWSTGASSPNITVTAGGTYTVTVTSSNSCTATASQTINQSSGANATISANGSTTVCSGTSVTLTAGGGNSFSWSTGVTTASISVNTTGLYTVTVTDQNGCTGTASQTVVVSTPTATITPNGSTTFCPGGSVTLNANTGNSYLWSNGSVANSITVTAAGTYIVTVLDANGCSATASQVVSVNNNPTTTITPSGSTTICASGGSVGLTAGTGTSYTWSGGATTQSITATTGGTYTVTVVIAPGCSATASQVVTQAQAINITGIATPSTGTNGAVNITVTNAAQPATYTWSNGQTFEDISGLSPGSYTVTVVDANTCTASATFTVGTDVGINNVANISIFTVYPNPAQNLVKIEVELVKAEVGTLTIHNAAGQVVFTATQENAESKSTFAVDASKWATGVYSIRFNTGASNITRPLVIMK